MNYSNLSDDEVMTHYKSSGPIPLDVVREVKKRKLIKWAKRNETLTS